MLGWVGAKRWSGRMCVPDQENSRYRDPEVEGGDMSEKPKEGQGGTLQSLRETAGG